MTVYYPFEVNVRLRSLGLLLIKLLYGSGLLGTLVASLVVFVEHVCLPIKRPPRADDHLDAFQLRLAI